MDKHRLTGSMFYLAGPMDDVPDRGLTWRVEIKRWLWKKGIGVLCPYEKAIIDSQHEDHKYYEEINTLKKYRQFDKVHE